MRCLFFVLLLLAGSWCSVAQEVDRSQLEKQKRENEARIKAAEKVLGITAQKKKATLGRVRALNHQILSQQKQVSLLEQELELIEKEIIELEIANTALNERLAKLKKEYADMLYLASKSSLKLTKLTFLLASSSFNDLIMRYKYLEQYTENRKLQVKQIGQVTATLLERQKELLAKKDDKRGIIDNTRIQSSKLQRLKAEQNNVIQKLSGEEKTIRREIADRKRAVKRLNNLISSLITKNSSTGTVSTAAIVALSANFEDNKSRLPWPVSTGFISDKFGVKNHPVLKNVKVDNNGVDIQTVANAPVSAVFKGKVLDISQIPGLNNVVAIQHGDYYTVYANLARVEVQINQEVEARQTIGYAAQKEGEYEINFQVWYKFDKQNPEYWLSKK